MNDFFFRVWMWVRARVLLLRLIFKYGGISKIPRSVFIKEAEENLREIKRHLKKLKNDCPPDLTQEQKRELVELMGDARYIEEEIRISKIEERQNQEMKVALEKFKKTKLGSK